jgi:hypothetical protein
MKKRIFLPAFFTKKMNIYILSIISVLAILLMFIYFTGPLFQPVHAQLFGNRTNLSNNTGFSSNPQITAFGTNVYVVWRDNSSGNNDIYFSSSVDNGTTFTDIENLSDSNGESDQPQITAVGDNVYVVWRDNSSGNNDIYFRKSSDKGNSFSIPDNLSDNNGSSIDPKIAVTGNNVYVIWSDDTSGNGDIYFISSADNGAVFAPMKNLSINYTGAAHFPQIEATRNSTYVVWQDETPERGGIRFRASNDNGDNFDISRLLSQKNVLSANSPQLAISENIVYVVWEDNSRSGNKNFDLLYRASTDGGSTFTNRTLVTRNPGDSFDPQAAVLQENMYAVWEDNTAGIEKSLNWDVRFRGMSYNGANVTSTKILSQNIGQVADFPQIAASESNLYVVWSDQYVRTYPGMFEVFFTFSKNEGRNFSDPINISSNQGSSVLPRIAASQGHAYIVWSDTTTGNGDIYFRSAVID